MRPAVDEAPCSQGQPLGVRSTSGRSIGGVRQAPSAFGILSRIQPQNQPAGLTVRVVAKHNVIHTRRAASATYADRLSHLLSSGTNPSLPRQGRAHTTTRPSAD